MTNDEWCRKIAKMSEQELFDEVMSTPEFLTDSYYRQLGDALRKRHAELVFERTLRSEI